MDDAVNIGMVLEQLVEGAIVGDIDLVELRPLAGKQFDAIDGLLGRIVQVVGDDDFVASFQQGQGGERSNVSGASAESALVPIVY